MSIPLKGSMSVQDSYNDKEVKQGRTLLGVKGSNKTLQLKKAENSVDIAPPPTTVTRGNVRSSVVVVTKGKTKLREDNGSLTDQEVKRRLEAVKENRINNDKSLTRENISAEDNVPGIELGVISHPSGELAEISEKQTVVDSNASSDVQNLEAVAQVSQGEVGDEAGIDIASKPELIANNDIDFVEEISVINAIPGVDDDSKIIEETKNPSSLSLKTLMSRGKIRSLNYFAVPEIPQNQAPLNLEVPIIPLEQKPAVVAEVHNDKKKKKIIEKDNSLPEPVIKSKLIHNVESKSVLKNVRAIDEDNERIIPKVKGLKARKKAVGKRATHTVTKIAKEIMLGDSVRLQDLANRLSEKVSTIVKVLHSMGINGRADLELDAETAEIVAIDLGHKVIKKQKHQEMLDKLVESKKGTVNVTERAPVIAVRGHVDHGKTSLLDALRNSNVASGEHGGITQHIGAYQVKSASGKVITFLDTPGHEAFTALRLRGAKVADIVVLVVAADDGIKEQTIEAINHAKAAGVPIIVAVNKIDRNGANFEGVKNSLFQYDLIPDDMGGNVMVVGVSAKERLNLDKLEEAIMLQAEMIGLQADPSGMATGYVIEGKMDKARGIIVTLLINDGSLKLGDIVVAGSCQGKIKAMINDRGESVKAAIPGQPVEVLGMDGLPVAGDAFVTVDDEKMARQLINAKMDEARAAKELSNAGAVSIDSVFQKAQGTSKELPVLFKADTHGSVEAIAHSLKKLDHAEVKVKILHSGIGGITESDVNLAASSSAVLLGFNVRASNNAKSMAQKLSVPITYYSVIYNLIDDLKAKMSGLLSPIISDHFLGYAEVRQVFDVTKVGKIAGCYVYEGLVRRNAMVRLLRNNTVIYEGKLTSLKRHKDDAKEVKNNFECGISLDGFDDIKVGDVLEAFEVVSEQRKIA